MAKKDALQETTNSMMERPDYIQKGSAGRDHITKDDMRMPRIAITQGLSPELDKDDPKHIEGIEFCDMFNSLSRVVYGRGPLYFYVIRGDAPRAMEFIPRKEGGGIRDRNVPLSDPRCEWTPNPETGKDDPPIATKFYDFLVLLEESQEVVALSMKGTSIKTAQTLNSLISIREADIYTGRYSLSVGKEKNDAGTYGVYIVDNAGWAPAEKLEQLAEQFHRFADKEVDIDRGVDTGEDKPVTEVKDEPYTEDKF